MSSVTLNLTVRGYGRARRRMLGKREHGGHPGTGAVEAPEARLSCGQRTP
jgi:hypothetical protein